MSAEWSGRTAIVTGGATGIGAAAARQIAARGVAVTVSSLAPGEGGEEVTAAIVGSGGKAQLICGDLSDAAEAQRLVDAATSTFGPPDIVIHAAGGVTRVAGIVDTDPGLWDAILSTNLRAVYLMMHLVLPGMIERRWGRFVTVASEAGRMPVKTGSPAYAAAKAGVVGLTKHVAREVARYGVTVNATAPSTTRSQRVARVHGDNLTAVSDSHPMGRLAEPEEQAAALIFLASPEASYVNGACLDVSGGSVNL